jgi:hypothetical protein
MGWEFGYICYGVFLVRDYLYQSMYFNIPLMLFWLKGCAVGFAVDSIPIAMSKRSGSGQCPFGSVSLGIYG